MQRLSVAIPAHNAQGSIERCLASILDQDGVDLEVIVADDCSTDDTAAIVERFARADGRVRLVRRSENGGEGPARNSAIEEATGEWLLCVDADDELEPSSLAGLMAFAATSDADAVPFRFCTVDVQSGIASGVGDEWASGFPREGFAPLDHADRLYTAFRASVWNKLFRISFLREHGLLCQPIPRIADACFVLSALSFARKVAVYDGTVYRYAVNAAGNLSGMGDRYPLSFYDACSGLHAALTEGGMWDAFRVAFWNWLAENLPYNLQTMNTLSGFSALLGAFKERGFAEFEFDEVSRGEVADTWCYDRVLALRTGTLEECLFSELRYQRMATEKAEADYRWVKNDLDETRERAQGLAGELSDVYRSASLKVGRALTALPRLLRDKRSGM